MPLKIKPHLCDFIFVISRTAKMHLLNLTSTQQYSIDGIAHDGRNTRF